MPTPRFAVDRMLGRLALWLRLIGVDASYGPQLSGRALLRHAQVENRTVLTRDRRLLRAPGPPRLFVDSDHFREQLQQVVQAFDLDPFARLLARCSRCNHPVETVAPTQVVERVPGYVMATQARFVQCPRCRRVYWPATHHEHVRHELIMMGFHPRENGST
jgi:uncharacterized protein with PIN domain